MPTPWISTMCWLRSGVESSRRLSLGCEGARGPLLQTSTTTSPRWSLRATPNGDRLGAPHLKERRGLVISLAPLEADRLPNREHPIAYVFYESGFSSINVM